MPLATTFETVTIATFPACYVNGFKVQACVWGQRYRRLYKDPVGKDWDAGIVVESCNGMEFSAEAEAGIEPVFRIWMGLSTDGVESFPGASTLPAGEPWFFSCRLEQSLLHPLVPAAINRVIIGLPKPEKREKEVLLNGM